MNYRQGDLNFFPLKKLPKNIKNKNHKKRTVLAVGEATNHNHVIEGEVQIYMDLQGRWVLDVGKSGATVSHVLGGTDTKADHEKIELPKGYYTEVREREKDWFSLSVRKVID